MARVVPSLLSTVLFLYLTNFFLQAIRASRSRPISSGLQGYVFPGIPGVFFFLSPLETSFLEIVDQIERAPPVFFFQKRPRIFPHSGWELASFFFSFLDLLFFFPKMKAN